ncbi:hypothetical protein ILYODFUR_017801 [Ilyodon furcidens]|uniref:Uncharacterized protein n=1 Tax=Ilyodon furcidens TaxID=33524 RepID=A0ABV0VFI0_9TELE
MVTGGVTGASHQASSEQDKRSLLSVVRRLSVNHKCSLPGFQPTSSIPENLFRQTPAGNISGSSPKNSCNEPCSPSTVLATQMPTPVAYLPSGNHLPHANDCQLGPGPSSAGSTPRRRALLPPWQFIYLQPVGIQL